MIFGMVIKNVEGILELLNFLIVVVRNFTISLKKNVKITLGLDTRCGLENISRYNINPTNP